MSNNFEQFSAQMLLELDQLSNSMAEKTKAQDKEVSQLEEEAVESLIKINNVFSKFDNLADLSFVENKMAQLEVGASRRLRKPFVYKEAPLNNEPLLSKIQSVMRVALTNCDKYMKEEEEKYNASAEPSQTVHLSSANIASIMKGSFNLPPLIGSPFYSQDLYMNMVNPDLLKEPDPAPDLVPPSVPLVESEINIPTRESRSGTRANANFAQLPNPNEYPQQIEAFMEPQRTSVSPKPVPQVTQAPPPPPPVASKAASPPPPPPPPPPAPIVGNAYVGRGAPPPPPMVGGLPGLPPIKVAAMPVIKKVEVKKEEPVKAPISFQDALAAKFAERNRKKQDAESGLAPQASVPPSFTPIKQSPAPPISMPPVSPPPPPQPVEENKPLPPLPITNAKENVIDQEEEEIGNNLFKKDKLSPGAVFRKEKKKGLFDDDSEDELPTKPSIKPVPFGGRASNAPQKRSLFDDEEEEEKSTQKLEQQLALASQYTKEASPTEPEQAAPLNVPRPGAYAAAARGPTKRRNSDSEESSSNSSDSSEERRKAERLGKPANSVSVAKAEVHSNIHKNWMEESMLRDTNKEDDDDMVQRSALLEDTSKSSSGKEVAGRSGTSYRISQIQDRMSSKGFDPSKTMQKKDPRFFVQVKDNIEKSSKDTDQKEEEDRGALALSPDNSSSNSKQLPVIGKKSERPLPSIGSKGKVSQGSKKKSLFDDEEEDSAPPVKQTSVKQAVQPPPAQKKKSSLFDDEEEDLPISSSKPVSVKPSLGASGMGKSKEESKVKKNLFDEEDDDGFKNKPKAAQKVPPLPSTGGSKKAGGNKRSLFDDDDDDFLSKPKSGAPKPPKVEVAAKKKVSLFDDSD